MASRGKTALPTILNANKNDYFLNQPTQFKCWRNIWTVPKPNYLLTMCFMSKWHEDKGSKMFAQNLPTNQAYFFLLFLCYLSFSHKPELEVQKCTGNLNHTMVVIHNDLFFLSQSVFYISLKNLANKDGRNLFEMPNKNDAFFLATA